MAVIFVPILQKTQIPIIRKRSDTMATAKFKKVKTVTILLTCGMAHTRITVKTIQTPAVQEKLKRFRKNRKGV